MSPGLSNKATRKSRRRPGRESANRHPRVSVVLCSFNRAGLVERAIQSVFNQTVTDWELIVVDDGSTDGSELTLAQIARSDIRVVLISRTNRGLAISRNQGLALARGTFVAFLDSDDELQVNHLEVNLRAFRQNASLDFTMGGLHIIGPRSAQYVPDIHRPGKRIHLSRCQSAGSLFAKRSILLEMGGFPVAEFGEDTALITHLKSAYRWKQLRSATYVYHCTAADRMCDVYGKGGTRGLREFRRRRGRR